MSKFTAVTRAIGRASLEMKKSSPTLMFAVGIVGVVGGAVLASRATLKVDKVLAETQSRLADINEVYDIGASDYTQQDVVRDKSIVFLDLAVSMTRLYGPAIIVGGLGIACLTGSHVVLTKRNAALTAAYAALDRSYKMYREHVRDIVGEEDEKALHYHVQRKLAEDERDRFENLKKPKKFKENYSEYAKFFDEASPNWVRNPEKNLGFLHCQQLWANDMLHSRGHLFLNEVYDSLGIPRTTAGQIVGWTMWGEGDQFVDFGIFNHHTDEVRAFVNGVENSILLDFNVDGVIYDKIER